MFEGFYFLLYFLQLNYFFPYVCLMLTRYVFGSIHIYTYFIRVLQMHTDITNNPPSTYNVNVYNMGTLLNVHVFSSSFMTQ